MKKYISIMFLTLLFLCGCDMKMNNTPTKQAEIFLGRYQTLHKEVLADLDEQINNSNFLNNTEKEDYRSIMKKHYQDLEYEIVDEKIDGNKATVIVSIEVNDYTNVESKLRKLLDELIGEDSKSITRHRIDIMKGSKDRIKYTLELTFTKENNKWVIDPLTSENMDKINGIYKS